MSWQLAKFIDPKLSCYGKLVWVADRPKVWSTKYSVMVDSEMTTGPTEGIGFATNVNGDDDGIPMVAYLNQLELQNAHAADVRSVWFREWKGLSDEMVRSMIIASR